MSTIKVNQWLNPDNTENGKVRAWVNFNGTGTVAVRAGLNISSITDHGVGDYTVNMASPLPDTNYAIVHGGDVGMGFTAELTAARTTSGFRVRTLNTAATLTDYGWVEKIVVR